MAEQEEKVYHGIEYFSFEDVKLTKEEEEKIRMLREKVDMNNPKQVLSMYNIAAKKETFHTPIGYVFLAESRKYLLSNGIAEEEIVNVKISQIFSPKKIAMTEKSEKEKNRLEKLQYRNALRKSMFLNIFLILLAIGMAAVVLTSSTPTILNYETKLQDKYASWQQELTVREAVIREKERALGLSEE